MDLHSAAAGHLPHFVTAPGQTDSLLVLMGVFLVAAVLALGVFFLWLHSLPERMVHNKWQYDFVAVLCLLALFTHVHALWIAALLLAMVRLPRIAVPNFISPLRSIARSLSTIAAVEPKPARVREPERVAPVAAHTLEGPETKAVASNA